MNDDNIILSLAIVAVIIAIVGFAINYHAEKGITGFATSQDTGIVNITIETQLAIRFQPDYKIIDWGSGYVNTTNGNKKAYLSTASGTVINGTWTPVTHGFIIENIGNVNCSLWLKSGETAASYLGGTNPVYQYNVTNNEANSCNNPAINLGELYDFNNTATYGTFICGNFSFDDNKDEVRVDVYLEVPSDSKVGTLTDTITATGMI